MFPDWAIAVAFFLFIVLFLPYAYMIALMISRAYFQAKTEYHRQYLRAVQPEDDDSERQ